MKQFIFFSLITFTLLSCIVSKPIQNTVKEIIINNNYTPTKNNIEVTSLKIVNNILYVGVKSPTACNEDDFNLYTSDRVLKSLPPKKVLQLEHISKNDNCSEKLNKELTFNIEKLNQNNNYKELVLMLNNKTVSLFKN